MRLGITVVYQAYFLKKRAKIDCVLRIYQLRDHGLW